MSGNALSEIRTLLEVSMHWQKSKRFILKIRNVTFYTDFSFCAYLF